MARWAVDHVEAAASSTVLCLTGGYLKGMQTHTHTLKHRHSTLARTSTYTLTHTYVTHSTPCRLGNNNGISNDGIRSGGLMGSGQGQGGPFMGGAGGPGGASLSAMGQPQPGLPQQGAVLMVYGLNKDKMNADRIFNLLCLYGNIVRVSPSSYGNTVYHGTQTPLMLSVLLIDMIVVLIQV